MDETLTVVCVIEVSFKSSSEPLITQAFSVKLIVMSGRARTQQMREEYLMIRIMSVCARDTALPRFSRIYSHHPIFASRVDMSGRHLVPDSVPRRGSGESH